MAVASFVISLAALSFTLASFWWLQARRGRLTCFPVQTFSGYLRSDGSALRIPLAIFNDGAVPLVVTDLRFVLTTPTEERMIMHFRTLRTTLQTDPGDVEDFAHPYHVAGRSVDVRMVEFASHEQPRVLVTGQPVEATVQAQVGHKSRWVDLGSFPMHVETMAHPGNYITYSNQRHVWPPGIVEEARVAQGLLRQQMGL